VTRLAKILFAAFASILLLLSTANAESVKPVQDNLHLLTTKENKDLTSFLLKHKTKILIITQKSDNIEEDALNLGRKTGVDIVLWYTGDKVRTEISTKLEGNLPDSLVSEIVQENKKLLESKSYYWFFYNVADGFYKKK
jgi:uncharacterized membrane protein YgcG